MHSSTVASRIVIESLAIFDQSYKKVGGLQDKNQQYECEYVDIRVTAFLLMHINTVSTSRPKKIAHRSKKIALFWNMWESSYTDMKFIYIEIFWVSSAATRFPPPFKHRQAMTTMVM
jgi:hypothetical protein